MLFISNGQYLNWEGEENSLGFKKPLHTLNAFCEEIVTDFFAGLGPDPENESDPSPFVYAHAPVKLSGNVVFLQEKQKIKQHFSSKLGDF